MLNWISEEKYILYGIPGCGVFKGGIQNSYVGIAAAYILFQTELVGKQVTTEDDGGSRCGLSSVPIVKYI